MIMNFPDFFRFNDWNFQRYFIVNFYLIFIFDLLTVFSFYSDLLSIFQNFFSIIVLITLPGYCFLRILKIHNLDQANCLLICVGISLSLLLVFGLLYNTFLPLIGIENPLSSFFLLIGFNLLMGILMVLAYLSDSNYYDPNTLLEIPINVKILSFCLLPLLTILGTVFMNNSGDNRILLWVLLVISLLPLLFTFNRIDKRYYPFLIFVISLSILFQTSLLSNFVTGFDTQYEFFVSNSVLDNNYWIINDTSDYNSLLFISLVTPILSILSTISIVTIFKVFFPILVAFGIVALYKIFTIWSRDLVSNVDYNLFALFSAFIVFFYPFFFLRPVDKQLLSQVFLYIIFLVCLIPSISYKKKYAILFLLAFSVITTHYGISTFFILSIIFAQIVLIYFRHYEPEIRNKQVLTSFLFIGFFLILDICWYFYTSNAIRIEGYINLGIYMQEHIFEIMQPKTGISYYSVTTNGFLWDWFKYSQIILFIFVSLGVAIILFKIIKKGLCRNPTFSEVKT